MHFSITVLLLWFQMTIKVSEFFFVYIITLGIVYLSKGISGSVSLKEDQSRHALPSAILPNNLFSEIGVTEDEDVNLIFGAYRSPILFQETMLENSNFEVASTILTISLDREVKDLSSDVEITMSLLSEVHYVKVQSRNRTLAAPIFLGLNTTLMHIVFWYKVLVL